MNRPANNLTAARISFNQPILWGVFVLYIVVAGFTIAHHEMWGDEIHSWNFSKGSGSYIDLISNIRYEGHPPVWYTILWSISKFTHNTAYVQLAHLVIASLSVFLLLFYSPFPFATKLLIPFGYFFLFEYAILSRNYAIGILLALCICIIMRKNFRYKVPLYYFLIFLLSNTHLLGLLLAGSLHLYFLLFTMEQQKKAGVVGLHIVLGLLIALPGMYFMFPPSDSQLNVGYWVSRWNAEQLKTWGQAPLRAFFPVPAWWQYNFWNTNFLLELNDHGAFLMIVSAVFSLLMLALPFFLLRKNRKSLVLFAANLLLSFIIAIGVFPLTSQRYAGFIYIGFIAAYWLYCYETPVTIKSRWIFNSILLVQIASGIFAISKDIRFVFSNDYKVNELLDQVPANERKVTDYWAMNVVEAFTDKEMYCVDMEKEIKFIQWNSDLGEMMKKEYRYYEGIRNLFQKEHISRVYMISTGSPETLQRVDAELFRSFRVNLTDKRDGAIEKGGNLYLYQISLP
jgi:hypothetical protein